MKKLVTAVFGLLFVCSMGSGAFASEKTYGDNPVEADNPTFCPIDGYKGIKEDFNPPLFFNESNPLLLGPIVFPDQPGATIIDVVVDLQMEHTFLGDIVATLVQVKPDGTSKPILLMDGSGGGNDLSGLDKYYFGDGGGKPIDSATSNPVQHGCYNASAGFSFSVYNGNAKEGEWYLELIDQFGGDAGQIFNWSVHLLCEGPVSVDDTAWGNVKALYR